ncbi:MAG: 2Fe-2S iron-sulfur cluster-binding protein [Dehalococcoidales bacterium]|jgi:NADH dehydrogenase/NADH:ubiquinone oxidoreductase subunit G
MITVNINGKKIQAEEGKAILEIARDNNIYIPSLCNDDSVTPYGACRLCLVEIEKGGRSRLVASCLYNVEDGLTIKTDTPRVNNVRRMVIELLLSRCPDSEVLQKLARKLGVEEVRFQNDTDKGNCILCGLCTRVCQEVVGTSAISMANRGVNRQMTTPFSVLSDSCIACGSCSYICPTGAISVEDDADTRTIIMPNVKMEFKLKQCAKCGRYFAPEKQLEFISRKSGVPMSELDCCIDCRD